MHPLFSLLTSSFSYLGDYNYHLLILSTIFFSLNSLKSILLFSGRLLLLMCSYNQIRDISASFLKHLPTAPGLCSLHPQPIWLMIVPSAGNTWFSHSGPVLLVVRPHWHFCQCCGWTGPCGFYFDSGTHFKKLSGNFKEQDLLLTGAKGTEHTQRPCSWAVGRKRERELIDLGFFLRI